MVSARICFCEVVEVLHWACVGCFCLFFAAAVEGEAPFRAFLFLVGHCDWFGVRGSRVSVSLLLCLRDSNVAIK